MQKRNAKRISILLNNDILNDVDELASKLGLTRTAIIHLALFNYLGETPTPERSDYYAKN